MNSKVEGADLNKKLEDTQKEENNIGEIMPSAEDKKTKKTAKSERIKKMNVMAQRQWNGQSPNLSIGDRVSRIRGAMKHHGYLDLIDKLVIDDKTNESTNNPGDRSYKHFL